MQALKSIVLGALVGVMSVSSWAVEGDVARGEKLSAQCGACHGADGNSAVPTFPSLAGQNAPYLYKQLNDIKSNLRPVPTMMGITPGLSDQDMKDLAVYFAGKTGKVGQVNAELAATGQRLYKGGNPDTAVPACAACHGPKGEGLAGPGWPALAGQHAEYTAAQLKAFRASGRNDASGPYRANDGDTKMMRSVAARLTDSEIEAVSVYLRGLY